MSENNTYSFYSVKCEDCGEILIMSEDKQGVEKLVNLCKQCYRKRADERGKEPYEIFSNIIRYFKRLCHIRNKNDDAGRR